MCNDPAQRKFNMAPAKVHQSGSSLVGRHILTQKETCRYQTTHYDQNRGRYVYVVLNWKCDVSNLDCHMLTAGSQTSLSEDINRCSFQKIWCHHSLYKFGEILIFIWKWAGSFLDLIEFWSPWFLRSGKRTEVDSVRLVTSLYCKIQPEAGENEQMSMSAAAALHEFIEEWNEERPS